MIGLFGLLSGPLPGKVTVIEVWEEGFLWFFKNKIKNNYRNPSPGNLPSDLIKKRAIACPLFLCLFYFEPSTNSRIPWKISHTDVAPASWYPIALSIRDLARPNLAR